MAAVSDQGELVLARGEGAHVFDEQGRDYLDAAGGLWFANVGHGRVEIAEATARQLSTLASYSTFGDLANRPALDLAERLAGLAPMADARVFFTSGGSDSVDTAVKLVRRYWSELGQPQRQVIITREHAYHGMHLAGTSLAGIPANQASHGSLDPAVVVVPWNDAEALERVLSERDDIGAFFCEPVIGAGGVYAPPEGYLAAVRDSCRRHDVLFVADEVITGYGRTGAMFASERWNLDPDIMLTAKGLTSGYVPMGAVVVAGRVAGPFWTPQSHPVLWRHGYTYSGHAGAAAAAMANLDILERENLVVQVDHLQHVLGRGLAPLSTYDVVAEVRTGVGLLTAVDFTPEALAHGVPARVLAGLRQRGVLTRLLASGALQISPPFVVTEQDIADLAGAIDAAIKDAGGVARTPIAVGHEEADLLPQITSDEGVDAFDDDHYLRDRPPHHG